MKRYFLAALLRNAWVLYIQDQHCSIRGLSQSNEARSCEEARHLLACPPLPRTPSDGVLPTLSIHGWVHSSSYPTATSVWIMATLGRLFERQNWWLHFSSYVLLRDRDFHFLIRHVFFLMVTTLSLVRTHSLNILEIHSLDIYGLAFHLCWTRAAPWEGGNRRRCGPIE